MMNLALVIFGISIILPYCTRGEFHECAGTDTNCHTRNGFLTCDSGYKTACDLPLAERCNEDCILAYDECPLSDSNCHSISRLMTTFNECNDNFAPSFSCNLPLTADCNSDCITIYPACAGQDTDCHTRNGLLTCDSGFKPNCPLPLTERCYEHCVETHNECPLTDSNCQLVEWLPLSSWTECIDHFKYSCNSPLAADCNNDCTTMYHACAGDDIDCHTRNGLLTCDSGWRPNCPLPLTERCYEHCVEAHNECPLSDSNCQLVEWLPLSSWNKCNAHFKPAYSCLPLAADCSSDCTTMYHACAGQDIHCHTRNGLLTCDSGYRIGCDLPLTERCFSFCVLNGGGGHAIFSPVDDFNHQFMDNNDNSFKFNQYVLSLSSPLVIGAASLLALILACNIVFMCYVNCGGGGRGRASFVKKLKRKGRGYSEVKNGDSEDSEAKAINVVSE